jgi:hypothetical protein
MVTARDEHHAGEGARVPSGCEPPEPETHFNGTSVAKPRFLTSSYPKQHNARLKKTLALMDQSANVSEPIFRKNLR